MKITQVLGEADPDEERRALDLLDDLLESTPAEREAALAALPEALAQRLRGLLSLQERAAAMFDTVRGAALPGPSGLPMPDERIGVYRIERPIGAGGMGAVYLAQDPRYRNFPVALKVLYPGVIKSRELRERFKTEIVASYRISHKNIIRAYEYFDEENVQA